MIATGGAQLPTVPAEAVQSVGGRSVVFVQTPGGFTLRPVTPGPSGGGSTPIVSGLSAGERVAGRGAFLLKAELSKGDAKDED
jgi:cobalt-zinc-cadmium efflux system membrane fusion protein